MKKQIVTGLIAAGLALPSAAPSTPYLDFNQWIKVAGYGDPSVVMFTRDMSNPQVTFAGQGVDYFAYYPLEGYERWDALFLYDATSGAIIEGQFFMNYLY